MSFSSFLTSCWNNRKSVERDVDKNRATHHDGVHLGQDESRTSRFTNQKLEKTEAELVKGSARGDQRGEIDHDQGHQPLAHFLQQH